MRTLIIEDHPKIRANIRSYLRLEGIESDEAITGQEGLEQSRAHEYGAIILDINLPIMNGREFLEQLRRDGNMTPVIALTSDSLLSDKAEVFALGADDYMTKPFESAELVMRLKALFRRREKVIEETICIWHLTLDLRRRQALIDTKSIDLSAKEWWVLEFLARNRAIAKNKTEILDAVWGESESALNMDSITVEVHIASLRKKLGKSLIQTIRNVGYLIS